MQLSRNSNSAVTRNGKPSNGKLGIAILLIAMMSSFWWTATSASDGGRLAELLRGNLASAGIDTSDVTMTEALGVVTLSGRVPDAEQKKTLLDLVRRTHGVKDVIDELDTDYDS